MSMNIQKPLGLNMGYRPEGEDGAGGIEDEARIAARLISPSEGPATTMVAEIDAQQRYIFANAAYCTLFGLSKPQVMGAKVETVLGPEAYKNAQPRLEAAFAGRPVDYNLTLNYENGETRYLRVSYSPELVDGSDVNTITIIVIDVTEQTLLSRTAQQLDERLKIAHQMSPDGFMILRACRDSFGKITDFEFEYTNEAGAKITGKPPSRLLGNRLLEVLPGNKDEGLFDAYIDVVETGETFETENLYQHDGIDLWVEITAVKLGDGFAVTFSDISERKAEQKKIADNANRLQRVLDNVIAFVGTLTPEGILKDANQPALDVANIKREDVIGKYFWDAYWWSYSKDVQDRLRAAVQAAGQGQASRYDADIRVSEEQKLTIDFQLNPVFGADGGVIELIPSGIDISARLAGEEHRNLLIRELNHRVKNSLATIQAMASQTIRSSKDLPSFEKTFIARLSAISAAHDILTQSVQGRASLRGMISRQIEPYASEDGGQLNLSGPSLVMCAESAHAIGLVLHELSTNAAKYGALSTPNGHVDIHWSEDEAGNAVIDWHEHGGPKVSPPARKGFGTRLIKQSLEYALGGTAKLEYPEDGFRARFILPLEIRTEA